MGIRRLSAAEVTSHSKASLVSDEIEAILLKLDQSDGDTECGLVRHIRAISESLRTDVLNAPFSSVDDALDHESPVELVGGFLHLTVVRHRSIYAQREVAKFHFPDDETSHSVVVSRMRALGDVIEPWPNDQAERVKRFINALRAWQRVISGDCVIRSLSPDGVPSREPCDDSGDREGSKAYRNEFVYKLRSEHPNVTWEKLGELLKMAVCDDDILRGMKIGYSKNTIKKYLKEHEKSLRS